jgi:hypothetical protein
MRIDRAHQEESTMRRGASGAPAMPAKWGVAQDPPTHLSAEDFELSTSSKKRTQPRRKSDSLVTSAPRPEKTQHTVAPAPLASPVKAPRRARASTPSPFVASPASHTPAPLPPAPVAPKAATAPQLEQLMVAVQAAVQQALQQTAAQGPQGQAAAVQATLQAFAAQGPQHAAAVQAVLVAMQQQAAVESQPAAPVAAPAPKAAPVSPFMQDVPGAAELQGAAPFVQFNGGVAFDPLAMPLPPEIAPNIYGWLRRLALQADLAGADRLLRDALADLTSSLSVTIIYASPDGFYTLGPDDEMPKDTSSIAACGRARRALIGTHSGIVPIITPTETIAVIQLVRNARQPAFNPTDHVTMAALARESASVMHHLVVQHLQQRTELAADKKSLYRPEALESHRKRGQEGVLAELSPKWSRRAYPLLVITMIAALVFGLLVKVPTYTSGPGVVIYPGTHVTAPAAGSVEDVRVRAQTPVRKGDVLVKLSSQKEEADLHQAQTELESAQRQYLFDNNDEQVRKSLTSAQAAARHAEAALEQRYVRSPKDGVVADCHLQNGIGLQFGEEIATIVEPNADAEVWALLPGDDRPRVHLKDTLRVDFSGYKGVHQDLEIVDIGPAMGAVEARKQIGPQLGDAAKIAPDGSYFLVKARLKSHQFKFHKQTLTFANGMATTNDVKLESKRFLATLLPAFDKLD